ncbi:MAG: anhydro-N-acetylmuramic acid kinase [Lautropia sp.]
MLYTIGLMSGTSIDAVDGVLVGFGGTQPSPRTLAFASLPMPPALRDALERLQSPFAGELDAAALAGVALSRLYAQVVRELLRHARLRAGDVAAIGAHGQTVRHRPEAGYTMQLLNGAALAEACGIDVVCDLRSADVAAGGQGAPLVPAFHAEVFGAPGVRRAIVNVGGIANVSLLDGAGGVRGFDTGPGNTLMDGWCRRHTGNGYDEDGRWAAQGSVDAALLGHLLSDPYFALPAPKSTGRDHFNLAWLDARLDAMAHPARPVRPEDVQATLLALTADTIVAAVAAADPSAVYLCGGGTRNAALVAAIRARLADASARCSLQGTDSLGIDPQAVEASAFAWLAMRHLGDAPGNLPSVTGARGTRVLGARYRASARPSTA